MSVDKKKGWEPLIYMIPMARLAQECNTSQDGVTGADRCLSQSLLNREGGTSSCGFLCHTEVSTKIKSTRISCQTLFDSQPSLPLFPPGDRNGIGRQDDGTDARIQEGVNNNCGVFIKALKIWARKKKSFTVWQQSCIEQILVAIEIKDHKTWKLIFF